MSVLHLDELTWPEVKAEIAAGRETVVIAFGSTEQHGPALPLGTDAFLGDALAEALADRLDAFVAPTVRFGCSDHHLAYPGTISLKEETFAAIVHDAVLSLADHGFKRLILLPTHGGNFGPLAEAAAGLPETPGLTVDAFTDLHGFVQAWLAEAARLGVSAPVSGVHAGEGEGSLMLAVRPELVKMDQAVEGFVGDWREVEERIFAGIDKVHPSGVVGDTRPATVEAGRRYKEVLVDYLVEVLGK